MNLKNLKKGQQVVMHTCMEAEHPIYNGKIWTCKTDSYVDKSNNEVVFLEGFIGSFSCKFLQVVNITNTPPKEIFEKKYKHLPFFPTEEVMNRPTNTFPNLKQDQESLIKQYIVYGFHVGTKWGKSNPLEQRIETDEHYEWCKEIKRKLKEFGDFKVVVKVEDYMILVESKIDTEFEQRIIFWNVVPNFEFNFEFEEKIKGNSPVPR